MVSKKAPRDLIVDCGGRLYVLTEAVMSPLVAIIDGLPISFFGKGRKSYLPFSVAIDWCRKEREFSRADKYDAMIKVLESIQSRSGQGEQ